MCEGTKGLCRNVWTWGKILSTNIRYFAAILRFVAIYALFGILGSIKYFFWTTTVFFGQEVHYNMVYIAYYTELDLQNCNYVQKRRICRKNSKYAPDDNFCGHFCPRRKAAKFCHLDLGIRSHLFLNQFNTKLSCCS